VQSNTLSSEPGWIHSPSAIPNSCSIFTCLRSTSRKPKPSNASGWQVENLSPADSKVVGIQQESLRSLVRAALPGSEVNERSVQILAALIDFPLWRTLREMGLSAAEATHQILELVHDQLLKENLI
jgi:hypothetical protein